MPTWDFLAEVFAETQGVSVVKVDCVNEGKPLCEIHSVEGYPTLKLFMNGDVVNPEKYPLDRNLDDFAEWLALKAGVDVPPLPPVEEEAGVGDSSADAAATQPTENSSGTNKEVVDSVEQTLPAKDDGGSDSSAHSEL